MATHRLEVLGPTRFSENGQTVSLAPRQASVLASLALTAPRLTRIDELEALVWGDSPPKTAKASLQNAVAGIRAKLEHGDAIITEGGAYRLGEAVALDANQLTALGVAAMGPAPLADPNDLSEMLRGWTGEAYVELADRPEVLASRSRIAELRRALVDSLGAALLAHGRTSEAVAHLQGGVIEDPNRVVRAALLAVALHRTGATGDALTVLELAERQSIDASGIGLPNGVATLRSRLLDDDPTLHADEVLDNLRRDVGVITGSVPIAGRMDELRDIAAHLDQRRAILLRGEGGIGKTALISAAAQSLSGVTARTTCTENPQSPYGPVLELLAGIVGHPDGAKAIQRAVPKCDPAALRWVAPALMSLVPTDQEVPRRDLRRERADQALIDLFAEVGQRIRLNLVIDDLHLAPEATVGIFSALASARETRIIGATRPAQHLQELAGFRIVEIEALDNNAVRDLIRIQIAGPDDDVDEIAEVLTSRTAGNAFFVVSTVRHLLDSGSLRRINERWTLVGNPGVPPTVESAVERRLDGLSSRARAVVELVACAVDPIRQTTIVAVLGENAAGAIDEALREGTLTTSGSELSTVHDLLGEATRSLLSPTKTTELHDRLARFYEASSLPDRIARIARHRFGAVELDPAAAVDALEQAAIEAQEQLSPEFAAQHLRRARDIVDAPRSPHGLRLAIAEGGARRDANQDIYVNILRDAAFAADEEGLVDLAADAIQALGDVSLLAGLGGADAEVRALVDRTIGQLTDPHRLARAKATASVWHAHSPTWEYCHSLWNDALAEAEATNDDTLVCETLHLLDTGTDGPHDAARRGELSQRTLALGEQLGDSLAVYRSHLAGFGAAIQLGTGAEVDAHVDAMEQLEPLVHNGRGQRLLSYFKAGRAHLHGDLAGAEAQMDAAAELPTAVSDSWDMIASSSVLLTVRREQARAGELTPFVAAMGDDFPLMGVWLAATAMCAYQLGDHDLAASMVDRAHASDYETIGRDQVWLASVSGIGRIAARLGRVDAAAAAAELLRPYAGQGVWCGHAAYDPTASTLAEIAIAIGELRQAGEYVDTALAVADRLNAPIYRGRTTVLAARVARLDSDQRQRWPDLATDLVKVRDRAIVNDWTTLRNEANDELAHSTDETSQPV